MREEPAQVRTAFHRLATVPLRTCAESIHGRATEGSMVDRRAWWLVQPGWQSSLSGETVTECKAAKSVRVAYDILPALKASIVARRRSVICSIGSFCRMANCFPGDCEFEAGKSAGMLNLSSFPVACPLRFESVIPCVQPSGHSAVARKREVNLSAKLLSRLIDDSRLVRITIRKSCHTRTSGSV